MRTINPIENLTIRKGKFIMKKISEDGVHPSNWKWFDGAFGLGWRSFAVLKDGQYHEVGITYESLYSVWGKMKPRKIKCDFHPNQLDRDVKSCFRVVHCNQWINLNDIYLPFFEDDKTKLLFQISNTYSLYDYFQPPTENVEVYWSFNPYAVFGTGWKDWCDPRYVEMITNGVVSEISECDFFDAMKNSIRNKNEHLRNLCEYTKINFLKN